MSDIDKEYRENGLVVLIGLLEKGEVAALRHEIHAVFGRAAFSRDRVRMAIRRQGRVGSAISPFRDTPGSLRRLHEGDSEHSSHFQDWYV